MGSWELIEGDSKDKINLTQQGIEYGSPGKTQIKCEDMERTINWKGVKMDEDQECCFGQRRFRDTIRTHSTVLSFCVLPLISFRFWSPGLGKHPINAEWMNEFSGIKKKGSSGPAQAKAKES